MAGPMADLQHHLPTQDNGQASDRTLREINELQADDCIFVPQLTEFAAVPLGAVMAVENGAESVPDGGRRHEARWDCDANAYDPLDPERWVNDALMSTGPRHHPRPNVTDSSARQLWFPQFAVLVSDGTLLAVSPSPPELARETEYQLTAGKHPHASAVVLGRPGRFLGAVAADGD